jgi:hypothetical protein
VRNSNAASRTRTGTSFQKRDFKTLDGPAYQGSVQYETPRVVSRSLMQSTRSATNLATSAPWPWYTRVTLVCIALFLLLSHAAGSV